MYTRPWLWRGYGFPQQEAPGAAFRRCRGSMGSLLCLRNGGGRNLAVPAAATNGLSSCTCRCRAGRSSVAVCQVLKGHCVDGNTFKALYGCKGTNFFKTHKGMAVFLLILIERTSGVFVYYMSGVASVFVQYFFSICSVYVQ